MEVADTREVPRRAGLVGDVHNPERGHHSGELAGRKWKRRRGGCSQGFHHARVVTRPQVVFELLLIGAVFHRWWCGLTARREMCVYVALQRSGKPGKRQSHGDECRIEPEGSCAGHGK